MALRRSAVRIRYAPGSVFSEKKLRLGKPLGLPSQLFYAATRNKYTGVTQDLQERLAMHNAGHVPHTSKFAPWYIETAIAFRDKEKAFAYERYLKSGAGRAYAIKHF